MQVFVLDDQKDDRYWCRRRKNNVAAKRSRDARRIKENQITLRAAFLESENKRLTEAMEDMVMVNQELTKRLEKYEPRENEEGEEKREEGEK